MTTGAPSTTAGLGPTRRRVLAALQRRSAPIGIDELTESLGLHANTLRFHLGALIQDGLATSETEARAVQGRPRTLYRAAPSSPTVNADHYLELAAMLVRHLRSEHPAPDPLLDRLGQQWGRDLAGQSEGSTDPLADLTDMVNSLGFTSHLVGTDDGHATLEITRCPYRELARDDLTVCAIHAGMMRGYLTARGAAQTLLDLEPWVTPDLCRARFGPAGR